MKSKWAQKKLHDLVVIKISNVDKVSRSTELPIKLCNYMDVYVNDYIDRKIPFMTSTATPSQISNFSLKQGDVIITKDSETPDDIAISTVVTENLPGVVCGYHLALLRPLTINGNFLAKQLSAYSTNRYFATRANGSTRYGLTLPVIENAPICFPTSQEEQQHIADILTSCDEVIEQTEKAIAKYQAIKTGMLQDLFTRGVDANGKLRPTPEEAPELYKDSPLGKIPNEWDIQSLGEITTKVGSGITPTGGESVYKKSGIMFLRSQNILRNEFDLADVAYIDEATDNKMLNSRVFFADVLLNITGASIGRCVCFDMEKSANVNQHVCIIRLADNDIYNAKLLSQFINSEWGISQINRLISGGNREGLNYEQVRAILFFNIPDNNDERKQILFRLSAIDEKISFEKQTLKKYISIKQGLMKRLLTPPEGALEA